MRTPTKERKSLSYREGSEQEAKKSAESAGPDQEEMDSPMQRPRGSRKRSAKGAKHTKAPMDAEGSKGTCSCGKRPKGKCNCGKEGTVMKDAGCGMKPGRSDALTAPEYLAACDLSIQGRSRTYIRARLDAMEARNDLKCGKGAISQGEKCHKGPATKAQGPNAAVQIGQAAKGAGLGLLEAGKWASGYNIGKTIASGVTQGQNQKANTGSKAASIISSGLLLGPVGAIGAARRLGGFGSTDLQQNASNQKNERKWRRSVGYRDSMYAKGFKIDYEQLGL
jgi:hypothetical protein